MRRIALEELYEHDLQAVQAVFEACEDYFVFATGAPAPSGAAHTLYIQLPEGCCYRDKHILGICDAETRELMGVIDAIVGYPDLHTLTLGLFLVVPRHIDSEVVGEAREALERWARARGAARIRIAAYEGLGVTASLLEGAGFTATDHWVQDGTRAVRVFERRLFGSCGRT